MSLYLNPQNLHIEKASDGTLRATIEGNRCGIHVEVLRAFPISSGEKDLVLRDGGGKELGILADLQGVESAQCNLLQASLANRYFLPKITKINSIFERFGSALWDVETDRGATQITTKALHEAIYEVTPTRFMLRDTEENRYEIPDLSALDEGSRQRFSGKV
ncbi:protein of unknown function (DUF1854) [Abditibacterium utsteinense]|uniref:DUF1854 domain-containing protein n=1 Tax=Abditibacterium utsteinense TaxID=1960156 RepID=A0A2S8SSP3_9BACT|nr:DUF1854 domain-containing protein [Abditibacterium utsteinense]PQV63807.1 protein of unknown function (DUF1854) [Abditibacterium utsteinense]